MLRVSAIVAILCCVMPAWAGEVEVTVSWDSFDGCGCLPPFDDPISCPPCPEGVTNTHPDPDVCGPLSLDGDWFNFGWGADMYATSAAPSQGFAAQCFRLGTAIGMCGPANTTFNEGAAIIIIYDGSAQAETDSTHTTMAAIPLDEMRIAQGLPEPVADGASRLVMDYRRNDGIAQENAITTVSLGLGSITAHPDATNSTIDSTPRVVPNDNTWHDDPMLTFDHYITNISIGGIVVALEPVGYTPPPNSDISICVDHLRYTYTANVADEETDCTNGVDDDLNGFADCDDPVCTNQAVCTGCYHDPVFDVDDDGDVDQDDFGIFQTCITGPGDADMIFGTLSADCQCMDLVGPQLTPDDAIDQQDYARFEACATGPDVTLIDLASCDD